MALQGAFFAGVSGMNTQSRKIASVSDNIVNSNTVGYKGNNAQFATLVTQDGGQNSYSAGGVTMNNRRNVDLQGMIESTGTVSDLAVSGQGMFVVNGENNGEGDFLFTRAGSFRQDSLGNFVNSSGYTLMAWPLDNENRIPGEPGNVNTTSNALLDSLTPVNLRSVSGAVAATTQVDFSINLDSEEDTLEGAGQTISFINSSAENYGIGLDDIIVPNNNVFEGANLVVSTPTQSFTYTYGGVSSSNDVSGTILGSSTLSGVFSTGITNGDQFSISNAELGTLKFTYTPTSPDPTAGQFNSMSTLAEAIDRTNGLVARAQNNRIYVSAEDANQSLTFADIGGASIVGPLGLNNVAASPNPISNDGVAATVNPTATPILGANTTAAAMTAGNGDTFVITGSSSGAHTFTFQNPGPNTGAGEFNSLDTLRTAINNDPNLSATIQNNRLSIQSDNPNETMTFTFTGTDFPTAMDLNNTTAQTGTVKRFSSLTGLQKMINLEIEINATSSTSGLSNAQLKIFNTDPLSTIEYDYGYPVAGAQNLLTEFSLTRNTQNLNTNADYARGTAGALTGPAYDPLAASADNMAGGGLVPHFSRNFEVYDPLGTRHDFRASFLKLGTNKWGVEVYALNPSEIISDTGRTDGLVTNGTILFNGDGTPRDIASTLTDPMDIRWTNGATESEVVLDFGTAGDPPGTVGSTNIAKRDGLTQISSDYNVQFVDQNGVSAALLSSIDIDNEGYVIANYRNGLSQQLFKIPLADFPNYNGLTAMDGNVFAANQEAGAFNLREATKGGVGNIKAGALEQSNIELADELTRLIIAQRGYESDTQILSTVNDLMRQLSNIF